MEQNNEQKIIQKLVKYGWVLTYLLGTMNLYISISLFSTDISLLAPIAIILVQLMDKIITVICLALTGQFQPFIGKVVLLEIFYLNFIFGFANIQEILRELGQIFIIKKYSNYLLSSIILVLIISNDSLKQYSPLYYITYLTLSVNIVILFISLIHFTKSQKQIPQSYIIISFILKIILLFMVLVFNSLRNALIYLTAMSLWYIIQNGIIIKLLQQKKNLLRKEKICLLLTTLLNKNHGYPQSQYNVEKLCSKYTFNFILAKSIILIIIILILEEHQIYIQTLIFQLEMIQPHLITLFVYKEEIPNGDQIIQQFQSKMEIIPFLSKHENKKCIEIWDNKKQKQNKQYEKFVEDNEICEESLTAEQEEQIINYLHKMFTKGKTISIKQYGIYIGEYQFVVEKCVSLQAIYNFMYNSSSIPKMFLPYTPHYLNLDFQDILMNRILRFQPDDQYLMQCRYSYQEMKGQLYPKSLSIMLYHKILSQQLITNPKLVLYDLYQF